MNGNTLRSQTLFILLLIAPFAAPAQTPGWSWVHPTPQGNTLRDVQFVAPDLLVAVGYCATFMTSSDGGVRWSFKHYIGNTDEDLNSLRFLDRNNGLAVGTGGTILKTTDGGRRWRRIYCPAPGTLLGIRFAARDNGFIVTDGGAILRSVDEGESWSVMPGAGSLCAVDFSDPSHGTIVGSANTILHTTDGGASWMNQNAPNDKPLMGVEFLDENLGLALSGFGLALRTTDGGAHWDSLALLSDQPLLRAHIFSPAEYVIVGGPHPYYGPGAIFRTTDGGSTWSKTNPEIKTLYGLSFSGDNGCAVGANGSLLYTTDRGASWFKAGDPSDFPTLGARFVDALNGWIVDGDKLLRTGDGGNNWSEIRLPFNPIRIELFDALDPNTVRVFGTFRSGPFPMIRTTDAGNSWSPETLAIPGLLYALRYVSAQTGFLAGADGAILKTDDGGVSWAPKSTGIQNTLRDLAFAGADLVYAAGDSGMVLRSSDRGKHWSILPTGTRANLRHLQFVDAQNGFAAGDSLLRTTDGGATWSILPAPIDAKGMLFVDSRSGYLVGDRGLIEYTSDAGATWQRQPAGTKHDLTGVAFADRSNGFVVGEEGTILRTWTGGLVSVRDRADPLPMRAMLDQNYPNPFTRTTTLAFRLPSETKIEILLYDALGRLVRRVAGGMYAPGAHEVRIDAGSLLPGLYFCRLVSGGEAMVRKMVVVR